MSRTLKKIMMLLGILCSSVSWAQSSPDAIMGELDAMKAELMTSFGTIGNLPSNQQRLESAAKFKIQIEDRMANAIRTTKASSLTDDVLAAKYDEVQELIWGLTAISGLKLNADGVSINPNTCIENIGFLRMMSPADTPDQIAPVHAPAVRVIKAMCRMK